MAKNCETGGGVELWDSTAGARGAELLIINLGFVQEREGCGWS